MLRFTIFTSLMLITSNFLVHSQSGAPITWIDIVSAGDDGVCLKKSGASAWNAGAASAETIPAGASGWFECELPRADRNIQFGVSSFNTNAHFNTIGTALYFRQDGNVWLYKGGVFQSLLGPYQVNDRFRIQRVADTLYFYQNGIFLDALQTNPQELLMADVSIFHQSAQVCNSTFYVDSNTIPTAGVDADSDPTNELISDIRLNGNTLRIIEGPDTIEIDLTTLANDADSDPTNELDAIFSTTGTITSNANGDYTNDDLIFGSPSLSYDSDPNHANRLLFHKRKGAFRAGLNNNQAWDEDSIGAASFASGFNSKAQGQYSTALGSNSSAKGQNSFAGGSFSTASGLSSFAFGSSCIASGQESQASGKQSVASAPFSSAFGVEATAEGWTSSALGHGTIAKSTREMAMGSYNTTYTPAGGNNLFNTSDRILSIGNGTSDIARSDALIVMKNGDVLIGGAVGNTSDIRLKRDVAPLTEVLDKVKKLDAISYYFNDKMPRTDRKQIGLKAQQIQHFFPELVQADGAGFLTVAYGQFGAVLLAAIQEQQQQIEEKDLLIETLADQQAVIFNKLDELSEQLDDQRRITESCCTVSSKSTSNSLKVKPSNSLAYLGQNSPNPLSGITTIPYYVDKKILKSSNVSITISSIEGKAIQSKNVTQSGSGNLVFDLGGTESGTYTYSLLVDGQVFDSRKLIVN